MDGKMVETDQKELLVTKESATSTGLTATADEYNFSLDTDHRGLVKYGSRHRGLYILVKGKLQTLVKEVKQEVGRGVTEGKTV